MAASKNNAGSTSADSTGGFKTVAFGFDKNDVTMYIASLRKKMKQMEEEFQDKLKEALENPAASNEALKHEREVIRSEMEVMWGDKLNERNQILKQQQSQINQLEESVQEKDKIIEALKTELSAANVQIGDGGEMNARAAKAYVQFTTTLHSITGSLQKTLKNVESTWKGEFEKEIQAAEKEVQRLEAIRAQQAALASTPVAAAPAPGYVPSPVPVPTAAAPAVSDAPAPIQKTAAVTAAPSADSEASKNKNKSSKKAVKEAPAPAPAKIPLGPFDFGDEDNDPLKGIIADISDAAPSKAPDIPAEPVKVKEPEPIPEPPVGEAVKEVIEEPINNGLDDFGDLGDLLAEPVQQPAPVKKSAAPAPAGHTSPSVPKIDVDDDLSALLADEPSDNSIKAEDEVVGAADDFADLLAEGGGKPDFGEDIVITEDETAAIKGDDLDVSLLSDMVIAHGDESNGDLDRMLKEQEANEYAQFGDLFITPASDEDTFGFQTIKAEETDETDNLFEAPSKTEKNEDDLFDFSFLDSNADDEDDMSTDAAFPGML